MTKRSDAEAQPHRPFAMNRFFYVVKEGWYYYWRSNGRSCATVHIGSFYTKREAKIALRLRLEAFR